MAVLLLLDKETNLVTDNWQTKDDWMSAPLVMANILQITATPPEPLVPGELKNSSLEINKQTISNKLTNVLW